MSPRVRRILRNVLIGAGAFLLVAMAVTLLVVNTDWFRNYVRTKIIASTEESTGGKVDIKSFAFDVSHLRAVVTGFVIHGREPATVPAFLQAARVQVDIRLFTSIRNILDVTYLGIDRPRANVFLMPDGNTNAPVPKQTTSSSTSTLQTVVDLAVGHFELTNGVATYDSHSTPLNLRAGNVHAQLYYNILRQGYQGHLDMEPLYVVSGRNTPVQVKLAVPVVLLKDRIDFHDARISTPLSSLSVNGSLENMNDPKLTVRLAGHIATADLQNAAGLPLAVNARNVPAQIDIDAAAVISTDAVDVTGLRATLGNTNTEASGPLKDRRKNGGLQFKTHLALGELGRLAKAAERPEGTALMNGTVSLDAANNLKADGNIDARNVSFRQGPQQIANLNLVSAFHIDPHNIDLQSMRLSAMSGEFLGNVLLNDFQKFKVQGTLRHLDLQSAAKIAGQKLPYDGRVSGPLDIQGDMNAPGTSSLLGNAHLTIAPGPRGIPLSGRLNADYNGSTDSIALQNSYLALPHSRLTLSGSVGKQLSIALTSTDLNDLLAAASLKAPPPVTLARSGEANFNGTVTGSLSAPRISGHIAVRNFNVEGRAFSTASADLAVSSRHAAMQNGVVTRGPMRAQFDGGVELRNWSAPPAAPLTANLTLANADVADLMALAGQKSDGYSGVLTANAHINGTFGDPQGAATLQASKGTVEGEPFDQMQAQVNLADQLVTVPAAFIQSGAGRIDLTGEFRHPHDSFSTGQVHAHVQSNQIALGQMRNVQSVQPNATGTLQLNADVKGTLTPTEFLLTSLNGDASARSLKVEGETYGDFTANARTAGQTVTYGIVSDFAGSNTHLNGATQLIHDYPTTADANVANLPIERLLTLAKVTTVPARGVLSGTAHVAGTIANPQGSADLSLTRAVIYNEPLDRVHARFEYLPQTVNISQLEIVAGSSRIDLTANYDHPANNLQQGSARFHVVSSHIDLARIHNVQSFRAGLGGTLDLNADGVAQIREKDPRILFNTLNANLSATGIAAQGHNYGDLKLTATTASGNRLNFALDSNLTGATLHGKGNAELTGDYPVNAQLTFTNVAWTRLQNLLGFAGPTPPAFEATTEGQVSIQGPLLRNDQLKGNLLLSHLNLTTLPRPGGGKNIAISNQGPIAASLDHGTVQIQSAHLTGPQTDIQASGTASLTAGTLNINLNANADLGVLQSFDRDIYSGGKVVLATNVRGTTSQPLVTGQMTLQAASFNYAPVPIGVSNANGTIAFYGNNARIQGLTAESGGGRVTLSGFVGFSDAVRFGLRAGISNVRLRVQEGVSLTADGDLRLTGTAISSVVSGNATVQQVTYAPQSDFGSILSRAAPPVQSPTTPSPLLDNMRLDIRVRTAPGMAVQASLAQNLQADADLRVRGTAAEPGVLGRVTINEGQLVFFGSQYTVDTGTIAFYNPVRIEPVLDISLETLAKGVTVTLRVTGPIDNMKLSYTSDPPLQFQEIVSLLASGRTPTSDPTLLANQPQQPAQGYQQMGESAIVGKALADPVSSRLERVFGVTQLKIDPSFTTGSDVPTAQLTLQQRITNNLTFTYVSAIDDPNSTIIRVEFAINQQYSAVATRDQNGIVSINFYYKKQFR